MKNVLAGLIVVVAVSGIGRCIPLIWRRCFVGRPIARLAALSTVTNHQHQEGRDDHHQHDNRNQQREQNMTHVVSQRSVLLHKARKQAEPFRNRARFSTFFPGTAFIYI